MFAPWTAATHCTGGATPGAKAIMAWSLAAYPTATNLGIYSCRRIVGTSSYSAHAEGRASDVGFPMVAGKANPLGAELVTRLRTHGDQIGIQALIFNRTIWSAKSPGTAGRPYTGANPHTTHVHIELTRGAAAKLTLATIRHVLDTPGLGGVDLARGDHGPAVVALQKALHVNPDGIFGPITEAAVNRVKAAHGLPVDGIAGSALRAVLGL